VGYVFIFSSKPEKKIPHETKIRFYFFFGHGKLVIFFQILAKFLIETAGSDRLLFASVR